MNHTLTLHRLYGNYGITTPISLTLKSPQMIGVVAANGVGKSTLLRLILGLESKRDGWVKYNQQTLSSMNMLHRAQVLSYLPQNPIYSPHWTIQELIKQGQLPHIIKNNKRVFDDDHPMFSMMIETLSLHHLYTRTLAHMSGGERQRAFIARTLVQNSQVLLLDEPLAPLDWYQKTELMSFLRSFVHRHHKICVTVLHDLNLAALYCDDILMLYPQGPASDPTCAYFEYGTPTQVLTQENIDRAFKSQVLLVQHPQRKVFQRLPRILDDAFHEPKE